MTKKKKFIIPYVNTVSWINNSIRLIDQRKLPFEESYVFIDSSKELIKNIKRLSVRGAPAIGVAAAFGCLLIARSLKEEKLDILKKEFIKESKLLADCRPTAVNLRWSVDKMTKVVKEHNGSVETLITKLKKLSRKIKEDDLESCKRLTKLGSSLFKKNNSVLTICNTGGLATSGVGTALGCLQYADLLGKDLNVFISETRPLLQGARLNTWELNRTGTAYQVVSDNMAAYLMSIDNIDSVIVGADRITMNGDTANKIGTYNLAVLSRYHKIPFYVAAPISTIDQFMRRGSSIKVENRSSDEITKVLGKKITYEGVSAVNPAFDITPSKLISAIITEKGIAYPPFTESIKKIVNSKN